MAEDTAEATVEAMEEAMVEAMVVVMEAMAGELNSTFLNFFCSLSKLLLLSVFQYFPLLSLFSFFKVL